MMALGGPPVDSQMLWDQIERVANVLAPLCGTLRKHIVQQPVVGMDQTRWRIFSGKVSTKRWQVWASCADNAGGVHDSAVALDRSGNVVLGDFSGIVMCDR